jgi:hypothetical protein
VTTTFIDLTRGGYSEMRKESTETDTAVAHNGIIKWTEPKGGLKAIYSDTMIFISEYLNKCKPLLFESAFGEIIEEATNLSRFVIMDIEKVAMIGYFELHHNIYYSNDSYAPLWSVLLGDYKESKYKSDAELDFNHISSYRIAFKTLSPVWSTANFICDLLEKKGAIVDDFWPAKDCIIIDVDVLPKFATFYGFEWFKVPKDEEEEEEYSEANTLDDDDCDGEYSDDCVKINCKFIDLCKERCEKEKEERYAG